MTLKAQVLLDVWTPWLEGVAVFAESAADPHLDPDRIGHAADTLRALVDFDPSSEEAPDRAAILAAFDRYALEFDDRAAKAIAQAAPDRLYGFFTLDKDGPYLPGYLSVRAVVAAWRAKSAGPINATAACELLLHATRLGIGEAIPNLALESAAFEAEARSRMTEWVRRLAHLDPTDVATFLAPMGRTSKGQTFSWRDGRLVVGEHLVTEETIAERVQEALLGLSDPDDVKRLPAPKGKLGALVAACANAVRDLFNRVGGKAEKGTLARAASVAAAMVARQQYLPVGRTSGLFYLNCAPDGVPQLFVSIRTTQAHVDTGRPSRNGLCFPISKGQADALTTAYHRLGDPRMKVTRVIDLTGLSAGARPSVHMLAFQYGDWFELRGATTVTDIRLRKDPRRWAWVQETVRERLQPGAFERVEAEIVAPGHAGARRTLDWLNAGHRWSTDALGVDDWADLVRAKAERVLDSEVRQRCRQDAARILLDALFRDPLLTASVVDRGLRDRLKAMDRDSITASLLATARSAGEDPWLDANADRMAAAGFPLFVMGHWGWDVRAPEFDMEAA